MESDSNHPHVFFFQLLVLVGQVYENIFTQGALSLVKQQDGIICIQFVSFDGDILVYHTCLGILMSTDLTLQPFEIIRLYGLRFKIEVSFKQAVRTIGAYAYHFWMKPMKPIKRYSGNQYIHKKPEAYRKAVQRKMDVYHRFVQTGLIAQRVYSSISPLPSPNWSSLPSGLGSEPFEPILRLLSLSRQSHCTRPFPNFSQIHLKIQSSRNSSSKE